MQIIILGAGQVGASLAENLADENIDITVVDEDAARLLRLQDRLDIRTVRGNAAHPSVLQSAGAEHADLLVAVTSSDEINMVACQVAAVLFHTPQKIARVRSHDYLLFSQRLFADKALPVDVLISPEQLVTGHVAQLLRHPGALQVLKFGGGAALMVALKVHPQARLANCAVADISRLLPLTPFRIVAIIRNGLSLRPGPESRILADDEIFFVAAKEHVEAVKLAFKPEAPRYKRVMIAGGGNIGAALAEATQKHYHVKVIEQSRTRCNELAERLVDSIIIHSSASEKQVLIEENIEQTDVFCALTDDDEVNIMASMLAKRLGARTVMALINNPAYIDLIETGVIDIALSPQQTTIGSLLRHIRRGDMASVYSLRHGAAESIEAVAHGDPSSSRVVGRSLGELPLPRGTLVGAVIRDGKVLIAHHDTVVRNNDHLILFVAEKRAIPEVERLFQVGFHFF